MLAWAAGHHRYLRAQVAQAPSNIWLGSLYVSIAGLDPPSRLEPSDSIDGANMDAPYRISHPNLEGIRKNLQNNPKQSRFVQSRFLAQIGDDNQPPGFDVASSPFKETQLLGGPTAWRKIAWRCTDGSKRDEEAAH
jgi:hypothetical protein